MHRLQTSKPRAVATYAVPDWGAPGGPPPHRLYKIAATPPLPRACWLSHKNSKPIRTNAPKEPRAHQAQKALKELFAARRNPRDRLRRFRSARERRTRRWRTILARDGRKHHRTLGGARPNSSAASDECCGTRCPRQWPRLRRVFFVPAFSSERQCIAGRASPVGLLDAPLSVRKDWRSLEQDRLRAPED